jgi:hypothetical protein
MFRGIYDSLIFLHTSQEPDIQGGDHNSLVETNELGVLLGAGERPLASAGRRCAHCVLGVGM